MPGFRFVILRPQAEESFEPAPAPELIPEEPEAPEEPDVPEEILRFAQNDMEAEAEPAPEPAPEPPIEPVILRPQAEESSEPIPAPELIPDPIPEEDPVLARIRELEQPLFADRGENTRQPVCPPDDWTEPSGPTVGVFDRPEPAPVPEPVPIPEPAPIPAPAPIPEPVPVPEPAPKPVRPKTPPKPQRTGGGFRTKEIENIAHAKRTTFGKKN